MAVPSFINTEIDKFPNHSSQLDGDIDAISCFISSDQHSQVYVTFIPNSQSSLSLSFSALHLSSHILIVLHYEGINILQRNTIGRSDCKTHQ